LVFDATRRDPDSGPAGQAPRALRPSSAACALLALLALLALFSLPASSAHAFCRTTTKTLLTGNQCVTEGLPLQWERQCISFSVEDPSNLGIDLNAARDAADRSFATWTDVQCDGKPVGIAVRQTSELARCAIAEYNSDAPNMNAILFVEDWADDAELPSDAFAVTLVWNLKDTGEIVDADMLLNPTIGNLTICGDRCKDTQNDIDLQNVMTHEAGHFLGLAHSDVPDSTMSATAPTGQTSKRDLEDDDRQGLCSIYGDLPPAACVMQDFVPRHGFSPLCRAPTSRGGCAVSAPTTQSDGVRGLGIVGLALVALGLAVRRRKPGAVVGLRSRRV